MVRVRAYLRKRSVRRKIRAMISVIACVVVFMTTYALLLPGLTLETRAAC